MTWIRINVSDCKRLQRVWFLCLHTDTERPSLISLAVTATSYMDGSQPFIYRCAPRVTRTGTLIHFDFARNKCRYLACLVHHLTLDIKGYVVDLLIYRLRQLQLFHCVRNEDARILQLIQVGKLTNDSMNIPIIRKIKSCKTSVTMLNIYMSNNYMKMVTGDR